MVKISGLPSDTSPLVSDIVPMVDNTAVVTKKVLLSDLITTIFNNAPAVASSGWNTMSQVFTYGGNNGNKEFTVTTPNDVTGLLWPGMRMKFNRGTTPPTQSMAFVNASSQFAKKTSPTGIIFTGPYTCEAWIYLNSYVSPSGNIISRRDSPVNSGFAMRINASGQLDNFYLSTGGNYTQYLSYQAIPLNQWTHVAAVVNSVAAQTMTFYINGLSVPIASASLAATSLVQAGSLAIGSWADNATEYFDGYISEARLWSNAQSQAQIQANMTKNLVGNEANLVGLWPGNGNFNDLTANANNLTQNGGAIATQASNPYNSTEYAIVTKVSYVNPTTTITLYTGNSNTIPNMTLGSPQYSTVRSPYGFPTQKANWSTIYILGAHTGTGSLAWVNVAGSISIPSGSWHVEFMAAIEGNSAADVQVALSPNNTGAPPVGTIGARFLPTNTNITILTSFLIPYNYSLATQTVYYLMIIGNSGGSLNYIRGMADDPNTFTQIIAYSDYL